MANLNYRWFNNCFKVPKLNNQLLQASVSQLQHTNGQRASRQSRLLLGNWQVTLS